MILLIDNYDSFTYNVAHALGSLGQTVEVYRSDAIGIKEIESLNPSAIVISPGPGGPDDAGIGCAAIETLAGNRGPGSARRLSRARSRRREPRQAIYPRGPCGHERRNGSGAENDPAHALRIRHEVQ